MAQATLDNVISDAQLVPYPETFPLSMAITEFHFLLLFGDRLQVVSRLNGAVVQVIVIFWFFFGCAMSPLVHLRGVPVAATVARLTVVCALLQTVVPVWRVLT